jgi:PAS domain S-box-containing protein
MVIAPSAPHLRSLPPERLVPVDSSPVLLSILEDLSALTLSDDPLDALLERLVLFGARLLNSRLNSLRLLDESRRCLVRRAALGLPTEYLTVRREIPLEGPQSGVCGLCARTGDVVIVEDTQVDPVTAPIREVLKAHGIAAAWAVPLIGRDDRVLGTFTTYYHDPQRPCDEQVAALRVLARHLALAIENARLMEHMRRQADAPAAAKLRLEAAFEQMEEGCVLIGSDRKLALFNPAVTRIFGQPPPSRLCPPGQEPRTPFFFTTDGKPLDASACLLNAALRGESPHGVEMMLHRPDGSEVIISVNSRPLWRKDGTLLGALAVFRDMTADRQMRHQLAAIRQLTEQLTMATSPRDAAQAAFEAAVRLFAPDWFSLDLYDPTADQLHPVLLMDRDEAGELREFTPGGQRDCDEVRQVLSGKPLVINRETGQEHLDLRVMGNGKRSASLLFVPLRRDGRMVGLMSIQSYALHRYGAADLPLLQELADLLGPPLVNARLRAELDEQRAQDARHERLRALEQMASGVAHNFNNSLTGVLGYADLLAADNQLPPHLQEMVGHIRDSAQEAANVVSRLQQFYRPGQPQADAERVDLAALVRETVESTRPRWHSLPQRSGTVIQVQLDLENVPTILGQPQELRDALTNLLFNAVEAMPAGGTVTITSRAEDRHVALRVADTGTGMPPDFVEHCFEPFFLSQVKRGSGLGLPTVHGVVARHGGQISVVSELGRGTEFTIKLPAQLAPQPAPQAAKAAPPTESTAPLRILAIDDEPAVRGVIQAMLTRHGHQVTVAPDGASGLEALNACPFDLVITDLGMPSMDGREVARRVKRCAPRMPVVLLTGWGESAGSMEGLSIDAILQKPVGMQDLLATVESLVHAAR